MRTLTKDHVVPLRDGGRGTLDNLVSACRSCNQRKGVRPYATFMERMRAERGLPPAWVDETFADEVMA